jgi:hypothetical protein
MEQILETGSGMWAPIAWTLAFSVALLIGWLIRSIGESGCQKGTDQTKVFISGEDENIFAGKDIHIVGGNLYWGYFEVLKKYYDKVTSLHTGVVSDYLLWMLSTLVLVILIGLVL